MSCSKCDFQPFPNGVQFSFVRIDPERGHVVTIEGDAKEYKLIVGQRFVPHVIEDDMHPAKEKDIVTPNREVRAIVGGIAMVSGVRTLKQYRSSHGVRQVELLGLPMRWFDISHFSEYAGRISVLKDKRRSRLDKDKSTSTPVGPC